MRKEEEKDKREREIDVGSRGREGRKEEGRNKRGREKLCTNLTTMNSPCYSAQFPVPK